MDTKEAMDLGQRHLRAGDFVKAEKVYRAILSIEPNLAAAHNNMGVLLTRAKRFEEADGFYKSALAIQPDYVDALNNMGTLLGILGHTQESAAYHRKALQISPDSANTQWNLSLSLLQLGNFAEAWSSFEARSDPSVGVQTKQPPPFVTAPKWQGESLIGCSLLVWPEQGLGDQIQFSRYVQQLKARGATQISIVCPRSLLPLFEFLSGVDTVYSEDCLWTLEPHDFWTPLLSIPRLCKTTLETIPAHLPYLRAPQNRMHHWRSRLDAAGLKIGLVWKGNPQHNNDHNRSVHNPSVLRPLLDARSDAYFFSLNRDSDEELKTPPGASHPVVNLGRDIDDLADTAAIVAQLDLLICVDTAVAHLAGALNRSCWVLLPYLGTDWRWLRGRADSPWYPQVMRLFRQPAPGDWNPVILAIADALKTFAPNQNAPIDSKAHAWTSEDIEHAYALARVDRFTEALALLSKALAARPHHVVALQCQCYALTRLGRLEEALVCSEKILEIDPNHADAQNNRGSVLSALGRNASALESFLKVLATHPDHPDLLSNIGHVLTELDRPAEALLQFDRALALDPGHPGAIENRARAVAQLQKRALPRGSG